MLRLTREIVAVAVLAAAALPAVAGAQAVSGTATVSGQANLYASGQTVLGAFPGGGGVLPPVVTFAAAAGRVLTFSSVTGTVGCAGVLTNGPDGGTCAGSSTFVQSANNISGITANGRTMFLAGVFLGPAAPASAAPTLTFGVGGVDYSFTSLSPQIGQVFFIGDGLTGTGAGAVQAFEVPTGATRLFLGFADAFGFSGAPGYYDDNLGQLSAAYTISAGQGGPGAVIPEPSTWALLGAGLFGVAGAARRRRPGAPA